MQAMEVVRQQRRPTMSTDGLRVIKTCRAQEVVGKRLEGPVDPEVVVQAGICVLEIRQVDYLALGQRKGWRRIRNDRHAAFQSERSIAVDRRETPEQQEEFFLD